MRIRNVYLAVALGLCLLIPGKAVWAQNPEEAGVRQAVQYYFDGMRNRDVETLKKAFHPDAKLYAADANGGLNELTQARWHELIKPSAQNPAAKWEIDCKLTVLEITETTAVVKTTLDFSAVQFTDYLSLLKLNGEWKIVNKIYSSKRKPRPAF